MEHITYCAYLNVGIFRQSTEDVTLKYTTPITPAPWALFVWDFIYVWIFAMFIYFLVGLCRRLAPAAFLIFSHIIHKRSLTAVSHCSAVSLSERFYLLFFASLHASKSLHLVQRQFRPLLFCHFSQIALT